MNIRLAKRPDSKAVAELSNQLGYPCTVHDVAERIGRLSAQEGCALFVGELDDLIAGWLQVDEICVVCEPLYAEISGLVVAEHLRNCGIGAELLQHAEGWARERGLQTISVRSNVLRELAHHFYLNNGYRLKKSQHFFIKELDRTGSL